MYAKANEIETMNASFGSIIINNIIIAIVIVLLLINSINLPTPFPTTLLTSDKIVFPRSAL